MLHCSGVCSQCRVGSRANLFFRAYPNRLCMILAPPFGLVRIGLRPLVALVESFSMLLGFQHLLLLAMLFYLLSAWSPRLRPVSA